MQAIIIVISLALVNGYNINIECSSYDTTSCLSCTPSYLLQKQLTAGDNYCQACSNLIIGCLTCQYITSSGTTAVQVSSCTLCEQKYDLVEDAINGFYCVSCPDGMFYDSSISQCSSCMNTNITPSQFTNCKRCPQLQLSQLSPLNQITCKQCNDGYYLNYNNSCQTGFDITNALLLSQTNKLFLFKQYLLTQIPVFKTPITNFQSLSQVCQNNGFTCSCNYINNLTSSRCTTFNSTIIKDIYTYINSVSLDINNIEIYNLAIESVIANSTQTNIILNKLDLFINTLNTLVTTQSLYQKYIRIILQIVSKLDYSASYTNLGNTISNFASKIDLQKLGNIVNTVSGSIVLTGNQYVFKKSNYVNVQTISSTANATYQILDITYDVSITGDDFQYMIFNRSVYNQSFTGILFQNNNVTPAANLVSYKIPYINSLAHIGTYYISTIKNNIPNTTGVLILVNNGTFNFNLSGSTNQNNIFTIISTQQTIQQINSDPHKRLRIQNLFYQSAVVYILVFLLLYMIFIPLCTFYDMCKDKKSKRHKKYVIPERGTMEDITVTQQNIPPYHQKAEDNQINYKQFFPIYNITATQNRPQRLLKLCLFLLNLQNPTTFLVILYVGVPALPVWAVLLAIPAYFLNIIFGYIYGFLKKRIPGRWKHSINIIPIGYWILWYYLMQQLYVKDNFTLFVIIFTVVLIIIDLIIDALQCMIMYFMIKQQNPIYDCIAPILSYRGYFDYDKYRSV